MQLLIATAPQMIDPIWALNWPRPKAKQNFYQPRLRVLCATGLLEPYVMQVKLFYVGGKYGYHLMVALTIHSYVTICRIAHKP